MSVNDIQTSEQEESQNTGGGFSIELLPIVDKDDKMEFLSNLSIVSNISTLKLRELGISQFKGNNDYSTMPIEGYDVFIENLKKIGISNDRGNYVENDVLEGSGVCMFQVKDVSEYGDNIVIETVSGEYFYGNFKEYLSRGLSALQVTKTGAIESMKLDIERESKYIHGRGLLKVKMENKVHSIAADGYCVVDEDRVAVLKDNKLRYYTYDDDKTMPGKDIYDLSEYGDINYISTDPNNNFYFIITEQEGKHKLRILNRSTLQEVQEPYEGINEVVYMSHEDGKLFCKDIEGYLRVVVINTSDLERGYVDDNTLTLQDNSSRVVKIQDTTTLKLKEALEDGGLKLNPDLDPESSSGEAIHGEIVEQIWSLPAGESTFREMFDTASTVEEINIVQKLFLQVQNNPHVKSVPGIIDSIASSINQKRFTILLESIKGDTISLRDDLTFIQAESDPEKLFSGLIHLETKLKTIEKQRSQIPDVDQDLDREISEIAENINATIVDVRSKNAAQVQSSLENYFKQIEGYLSGINYLPQITSVYDTSVYKEAIRIIEFFDEDEKKEHIKNLDKIIQSHMQRVESARRSHDDEVQNQVSEKVTEITNQISQLQRIIASIDDQAILDSLESADPLVMKVRDGIISLPKAEGDVLQIHLENIFKERNQEIRMSQLYTDGVSVSLDEYGIDTGLYYADLGEKSIGFKLEGSRTAEGNIRLALHYDDGTVFDIDSYLRDPGKYAEGMIFTDIPTELSQKDFIEHQKNYSIWLNTGKKQYEEMKKKLSQLRKDDSDEHRLHLEKFKKYLEKFKSARILEYFAMNLANKLDLNPRSHLSLPDPRFIVLDEERDIFKKMSAGFSIQKREQKGIEILEGDPGLGKTMICEEFGAMTNREVVRIQCSKMDPSDLFFSPQLKAGETSRQPAEWIKIMQKPGVLLLFDEIDKLDPQCFERLHRLFDSGRSIYDPQIGTIRAHTDCLFVATRNSYEILSNPIVSRSSIMQINAPSEVNEAYKVAKYTGIDYFKHIDFDEFKDLYTGGNTNTIKSAGSEKLSSILDNIRGLIKMFHILRAKQKSEDFNEKFEFEVSYRDAEQIFLRHTQFGESSIFKEVVAEVLIPKARAVVKDFEDKDIQEKIVKDAISDCFT